LFSLAFAGLDAVLVVRDQVLEQGRVVEYVGTQRYPIQSEAELELLVGQLNRPARPARFVFDPHKGWVAVQKTGYRLDSNARFG